MEKQKLLLFSLISLFLVSLLTGYQGVQCAPHDGHHNALRFRPTKLFVFGDSYADTGNKNTSGTKPWKEPYGYTFPGKPAGRFSDGRVLTDFIANFMGVESPVPYRRRHFVEKHLHFGMNFAIGGAGVFKTNLEETNMTTQIDFFEKLVNDSVYTKVDLQSSIALVTLAGNDYCAHPKEDGSSEGLPYKIRLTNQLAVNLKRIHGLGVRKIAVTSLEPMGCLPRSTAISSFQWCNLDENMQVRFHNHLLQQAVAKLNNESNDKAFIILDLYDSFISVVMNKRDHLGRVKFETPLKPCCIGINMHKCGSLGKKGEKLYTICDNPESTFFWDSVHPTQAGWNAVFSALKATLEQIYQ